MKFRKSDFKLTVALNIKMVILIVDQTFLKLKVCLNKKQSWKF